MRGKKESVRTMLVHGSLLQQSAWNEPRDQRVTTQIRGNHSHVEDNQDAASAVTFGDKRRGASAMADRRTQQTGLKCSPPHGPRARASCYHDRDPRSRTALVVFDDDGEHLACTTLCSFRTILVLIRNNNEARVQACVSSQASLLFPQLPAEAELPPLLLSPRQHLL
ncbi:uncharacterized protein LAESUDRAFT_765425 [Laetiporus sulphureus 93-53]|uniref:Uncharacterized protein n=1 Tax=Laetiporus sulphureus 93-53 TaxID=1314785 RepID=A0A165ARV1_9APHY|nr:uncharacterized protein LAESUDRAFT_765425 [Laetiporus sulphureus 93-53]KZS99539.1 hypothetical protein LAESUDRAFT_765425 [Laetiporus sulphureus 93-53]